MHMKKAVLAAIFTIAAFQAQAGEPFEGWGKDKGEAAAVAEKKAQDDATRRGTCITTVDYDKCRQDKDKSGWICTAYSANHKSSCN